MEGVEDTPVEAEGKPVSDGRSTLSSFAPVQADMPPSRHIERATTSPALGSDRFLMTNYYPREPA